MIEIKEVTNELMAVECDNLLTKLIQSDRRFDTNIKKTFKVKDFYINKFNKNYHVLFLAYCDDIPVRYIYGYIKDKKGEFVHNSVAHIDALYVPG